MAEGGIVGSCVNKTEMREVNQALSDASWSVKVKITFRLPVSRVVYDVFPDVIKCRLIANNAIVK